MDNKTHDALRSLIGAREDLALHQLENNQEYKELCSRQEKSEEVVEELYQQFEKNDRITIRRHYEGELQKTNYKIKTAYIQGLRDCFMVLEFLGGNEIHL